MSRDRSAPGSATPSVELSPVPSGELRTVVFHGTALIAGAPVASVIVLASVVAVLSFIPFSVALSAGNGFPMAQGVYSLTGWLLGPWAGATASGVGALIGVFLAPHTAGISWITVGGAASGALFAGVITRQRTHRLLTVLLSVVIVLEVVVFVRHAVFTNGVRPSVFVAAYMTHLIAIAGFLLPIRGWVGGLIASPDLRRVALGLFLGTWMAASLMMFGESMMGYLILNWPDELFVFFAGIIPLEQAARSGIGAVVGTGVIAGLRSMSLVKPRYARY